MSSPGVGGGGNEISQMAVPAAAGALPTCGWEFRRARMDGVMACLIIWWPHLETSLFQTIREEDHFQCGSAPPRHSDAQSWWGSVTECEMFSPYR